MRATAAPLLRLLSSYDLCTPDTAPAPSAASASDGGETAERRLGERAGGGDGRGAVFGTYVVQYADLAQAMAAMGDDARMPPATVKGLYAEIDLDGNAATLGLQVNCLLVPPYWSLLTPPAPS